MHVHDGASKHLTSVAVASQVVVVVFPYTTQDAPEASGAAAAPAKPDSALEPLLVQHLTALAAAPALDVAWTR